MKKLITLFSIIVLASCITFGPKKNLAPDIWKWYELHSHIMQAQVPEEVDPKRPTEAQYFVRLPQELQRKYMDMFWKIRFPDTKEKFGLCVAVANVVFRADGGTPGRGWRSDRGMILLMCGQPDDARNYRIDEKSRRVEPANPGDEEWDGYGIFIERWVYQFGVGFWRSRAEFVFTYDRTFRRWMWLEVWNEDQRRCRAFYQDQMSPLFWEEWQAVVSK